MPRGVKRLIMLTHSYLGVAFAVLSVMWFASGIVLAYNPFPALYEAERLRLAPPLDCATCRVSEAEARTLVGSLGDDAVESVRLGMLGARPVWRVRNDRGAWRAVFADSLSIVPMVDSTAGAAIALAFARHRNPASSARVRVKYSATLTSPDQWTLEEPLPSQLPLLRFEANDEDDSRIYVSQAGAEVVMYSTHRQRTMAWLGAIPHWIYPTILRRHVSAWSVGIIVLSALGTVMSLAGIAIGVWQWRWRVRRTRGGIRGRGTPYRDIVMRWHHMLGLLFGAVVCSWMFSGLMSMNPGHWSPGSEPGAALHTRWSGTANSSAVRRPGVLDGWRTMSAGGHSIAEIRPERRAGRPYYNGTTPDGHGFLVAADSTVAAITEPAESALIDNARRALAGAPLVDARLLVRGDDYYRETEGREIVDPVLRLRFADAHATWLYIDRTTGRLLATFETRSRVDRWLYTGLHDLDFRWILDRPPLWDVLVVGLSLGGLIASLSGAILAWRWVRDFRRSAPRFRKR